MSLNVFDRFDNLTALMMIKQKEKLRLIILTAFYLLFYFYRRNVFILISFETF